MVIIYLGYELVNILTIGPNVRCRQCLMSVTYFESGDGSATEPNYDVNDLTEFVSR